MCQDDGTVRRQSHLLTIQKKKQKWGDCNFFVCLCSPHLPFTCQNFFEKNLGDIWPPPPKLSRSSLIYIYIYNLYSRTQTYFDFFFLAETYVAKKNCFSFFLFLLIISYIVFVWKKNPFPHIGGRVVNRVKAPSLFPIRTVSAIIFRKKKEHKVCNLLND